MNNLNLVVLATGRFLEWIVKNIIQFREIRPVCIMKRGKKSYALNTCYVTGCNTECMYYWKEIYQWKKDSVQVWITAIELDVFSHMV